MKRRTISICGTIAALILACTVAPFEASAGYGSIVRHWTKHARIFEVATMDARLMWSVTMLSDEVLDAQRALVEKRKMNVDIPTESGVNFFINMYAHDELKNFSLDKSSNWEIVLVGADGNEINPLKIEPVTLGINEECFYPHLHKWSKGYHVQFPSIDLGKEPTLTLRSMAGSSTLKWKI